MLLLLCFLLEQQQKQQQQQQQWLGEDIYISGLLVKCPPLEYYKQTPGAISINLDFYYHI
jgi:hypothetical protein